MRDLCELWCRTSTWLSENSATKTKRKLNWDAPSRSESRENSYIFEINAAAHLRSETCVIFTQLFNASPNGDFSCCWRWLFASVVARLRSLRCDSLNFDFRLRENIWLKRSTEGATRYESHCETCLSLAFFSAHYQQQQWSGCVGKLSNAYVHIYTF